MAAYESGTHETDGAIGTKGEPVPDPVPAAQPDTSGVGLVDASDWALTDTSMTESPETTVGTVVYVEPGYKAPPGPVPGENKDTTWTDYPATSGQDPDVFDPDLAMSGTKETAEFGAYPAGSSAVPVAPAAPTAISGDRYVQVSWVAVADPAVDAPVLQYVVESDTGGHEYAGADKTTVRFVNVTGGRAQKFRVAAVNRNGHGPFGPWSTASVSPTNEDLIRPSSLAADNAINPIYRADGTIVEGSYGSPKAPGKPTVAAQGTAGTATVTWSASTPQPLSYTVRASSGQTATAAGNATTANVAGLPVGESVTFTVTAVGQLQSNNSVASDPYTVA